MTEDDKDKSAGALSLPRVLTFSLANLPIGAINIAVFVYLPPYFAGHLGVGMALVGAAWGFVRMIDIPIDVILAVLMDRTRTSLGRYRVWMIAGAPILMLGVYRLFMAPHGFGGPYLVGWLLVMYLGYSTLYLSTNAWGATLATLYHERSRLFGGLTAVGVVGALSVLMIPILGHGFGRTNAQSVQAMGWFIIGVIPLCVGVASLRTRERVTRDHKPETFPLKDYWQVLIKPELVRLFLAQMALTLGPGWMSAMYLFFFTDAWGFTVQQASILLAVYILAGLPGAVGTAALARRIGKHRTLMVTTTCFSLGILSIFITPKANVPAALPIMVWLGAMAAGFGLTVNAMLADVGDEVRLIQGRERISMLYAVNALASKIAAAFSILLTFPLLEWLGFNPAEGAVNTPAAVHNLTIAFIAGPIVFVMLGGACVIGWRLDARRQGEIRGALDARDAELQAARGLP
ncbi:MAG: major facilitator superfamily 1 [Caulobacteraceae bacterium]|nr:major facilitator superfamily 1 [Caulobacteraceae bacterium]